MIALIFSLLISLNSNVLENISKKDIEKKLKALKKIDINSDKVNFSLMGDLEGTSIILKVRDRVSGNKLAVFKPASGSTNYRAEIAAFRLSKYLDFYVYPPSIKASLNVETLKKVKNIIENKKFKKVYGKHNKAIEAKIKNQKEILKKINELIKNKKPLVGALKTWIYNLQFCTELGTLKALKKHKVYKYLSLKGPKIPKKEIIKLKQCSKLFKPHGCVIGYVYLDELAKDLSSIILLDAILSNRDRFPGGNVHFRSVTKDVKIKEKEKIFPIARLFSLDNGAMLKNVSNLKNLKYNVSRFNKNHIEKLKELKTKEDKEIKKILFINDEELKIFKKNLENTISYIKELNKKYKNKIYFL
jgi:hypothetical protein